MLRRLVCCLVLVACETAEPTPAPIIPAPPPPADAAPAPEDAPLLVVNADINCYANGPKELIRIETDAETGKGLLRRATPGPVPDRYIKYVARSDGPRAVALVFDGYESADYKRYRNAPIATPREKLERGKSVIARVFVDNGRSYIRGETVDLHTGMISQRPDHAYVCDPPERSNSPIYVPP